MPEVAGCSGTPLATKLGVKPGSSLRLVAAPDAFEDVLAPLPAGVTARRNGRYAADVVAVHDVVRRPGRGIEPRGLVDNKVCAVTDIWSGLRFVWRKENR